MDSATVKNILNKCCMCKDPYLSTLEYRNTSINKDLPSPSQILNSRSLGGVWPVNGRPIEKRLVHKKQIRQYLIDQKYIIRYFTFRCDYLASFTLQGH